MTLPCSWDVSCEVCPDFADLEDWQRDSALWLASTWLWAATGRRFGTCPVTIEPQQGRGEPVIYRDYPVFPGQQVSGGGPFLFGGRWFNAACGQVCCTGRRCAVVLRGPVASVTSVTVDGEMVPNTAYRVYVTDGVYLLDRVDGECWPTCGGMEVTYRLGQEIPEALKIATAMLACQYADYFRTGECKLPARMTSLSRQGVTVEVEPPLAGEETGIKAVDDVVRALNPSRRQGPPVVLSPDLPESCDRMTIIPAGG